MELLFADGQALPVRAVHDHDYKLEKNLKLRQKQYILRINSTFIFENKQVFLSISVALLSHGSGAVEVNNFATSDQGT